MKAYLNAKLILFKEILKKGSTIISDKEIKQFSTLKKISKRKNFRLLDISGELRKIKIHYPNYNSDFKIRNLAMAIKALKLCGLNMSSIFRSIKKLKDINGRLELVKKYPNGVKIFVDYAHTPDALLNTLKSLKSDYGKDISQFLVMEVIEIQDHSWSKQLTSFAKIYITDDNPRNENPSKIRNELLKHIHKKKACNIGVRAFAIKKAISNAEDQELIVIAGKGHEEHQVYKNKTINISDKKIIKKLNIKFKTLNKKKLIFSQNKSIISRIFRKKISLNFNGFSIDSRTIKKDNLFLAFKGKKHDGKKFIDIVLKKGAGCVVSSTSIKNKNKKILKYRNLISFLNQFANHKRELTTSKIVAITGSAGKTSLKNLIKNLLQNFGKTYYSPKSFNNHLGVPLSLSNLSYDDKFGIFEVGMSKAGEINKLTKLIKPQIAVITNIGEAHIENFKNIEGIAKAKSEIIKIQNLAYNNFKQR